MSVPLLYPSFMFKIQGLRTQCTSPKCPSMSAPACYRSLTVEGLVAVHGGIESTAKWMRRVEAYSTLGGGPLLIIGVIASLF
jgi:hypothetical protein